MKRSLCVALFAVSAFVVSPACLMSAAVAQEGVRSAAGKISLRPRLKVNDEHRFKMVLNIDGKQTGMGAEQKQMSKQEIGLVLRVKQAGETGSTLELVYESIKFVMESGDVKMEFDSASPAKSDEMNPVAPMLRPIVGTTLTLQMDKNGNITSVKGGESLAGTPAADIAGQFTGDDVIKNLFGPIFSAKTDDGEAAIGETWTSDDTIESPMGNMKIKMIKTLKSVSGGVAKIDLNGSVTLDASANGPVSIKDSSIKGNVDWDTESGMLTGMQTQQKLIVESTMGDQKVTSTQDMKMNLTKVGARR